MEIKMAIELLEVFLAGMWSLHCQLIGDSNFRHDIE
jgi:hypothetical protein